MNVADMTSSALTSLRVRLCGKVGQRAAGWLGAGLCGWVLGFLGGRAAGCIGGRVDVVWLLLSCLCLALFIFPASFFPCGCAVLGDL